MRWAVCVSEPRLVGVGRIKNLFSYNSRSRHGHLIWSLPLSILTRARLITR